MIKKTILFVFFFFIASCSKIEFVLDSNEQNQLIDNVKLLMTGDTNQIFSREVNSYFGNSKNYEFILKTAFKENKKNRVVKKNQVAERVDYVLETKYELFYKTNECKVFNKKIATRFSFTPKSSGYNFGTDRSFETLFTRGVRKNISDFIGFGPFNKNCL